MARSSAVHEPQQSCHTVAKHIRRWQKADNDVRLAWEIEKVSGVSEDVLPLEQIDHQLLFRSCRGHANNGRPTAFHPQDIARRDHCRGRSQRLEIAADPRMYCGPHRGAGA